MTTTSCSTNVDTECKFVKLDNFVKFAEPFDLSSFLMQIISDNGLRVERFDRHLKFRVKICLGLARIDLNNQGKANGSFLWIRNRPCFHQPATG